MFDVFSLIPSKDMKNHLISTNYSFSEREVVAIILNSTYTLEDRVTMLNEFITDCRDVELRGLILSYIDSEMQFLNNFKKLNPDEFFKVYSSYDDYSTAFEYYTRLYDTAYSYGKQFLQKNNADVEAGMHDYRYYLSGFSIEKIKFNDTISSIDDDNCIIESIDFDSDAKMIVNANVGDSCIRDIECDTIINATSPFRNGDIVTVCNDKYDNVYVVNLNNDDGTVHPRDKYGNVMGDYSDYCLFLENYDEKSKEFYHHHVSPFEIEFCRDESRISEYSPLWYASHMLKHDIKLSFQGFTLAINGKL